MTINSSLPNQLSSPVQFLSDFLNISFPSILFCYHIVHGLPSKTSILAFSGITIHSSTASFLTSLSPDKNTEGSLPHYQIWTPLLVCQRAIILCLLYLSNLIFHCFWKYLCSHILFMPQLKAFLHYVVCMSPLSVSQDFRAYLSLHRNQLWIQYPGSC